MAVVEVKTTWGLLVTLADAHAWKVTWIAGNDTMMVRRLRSFDPHYDTLRRMFLDGR